MSKPNISPEMSRALEQVFAKAQDMSPGEYQTYIDCIAVIAIGAMRGAHGDGYARGFLQGAINDLDNPSQTYVMPTAAKRHH